MVAALQIQAPADQPIHIVQITDAHLGKLPGTALLGMDTDASLGHVLKQVKAGPRPAVLLCTGDLSNDGSAEAYQRFEKLAAEVGSPQVWLPGNHDERQWMEQVLGANSPLLSKIVELGNWVIVMLDSSVVGKVEGALSRAELAFLDQTLKHFAGRHILICVHHHVLPVSCAWLDHQRIANSNQLLMLLEHYPEVKAVVSGHVHQDFSAHYAQFQVITSPSTCIQFAANSDSFKIDADLCPGYRWFSLHSDGSFATGVERVQGVTFTLDLAASGY